MAAPLGICAEATGMWVAELGSEGQCRAASEASDSIMLFLWETSRLSGPELSVDRFQTDSFLVPKERSAGPRWAWGMAGVGGAAQSILVLVLGLQGLRRLSLDHLAPRRMPWTVRHPVNNERGECQ